MILVCPACGARYRLADGAIPITGRAVQCASCKHSWHASAPEPAAAPAAQPAAAPVAEPAVAPAPAPAPIPRPAPPPAPVEEATPPRPAHWLWTVAAIVLGLVLTVLAASVWRADLSALGIEMPVAGGKAAVAPAQSPLIIEATVQLRLLPSGGNFMAVTGTITNPTKVEQPVTAMNADILDAQGNVLDSWIIPAPLSILPAGRSVGFDSAASNINPAATSLSVHFPGSKTSPTAAP